jgi:hypothetical protein
MPRSIIDEPEHWRQRAEEARKVEPQRWRSAGGASYRFPAPRHRGLSLSRSYPKRGGRRSGEPPPALHPHALERNRKLALGNTSPMPASSLNGRGQSTKGAHSFLRRRLARWRKLRLMA